MKLKKRFNLATKFNLLTILLILVTAIGIALYVTHNDREKHYQYLFKQGRSVAAMIAKDSEYAIYTEDYAELLRISKSLSVLDDISYVVIMDRDMNVLLSRSFGKRLPSLPREVQKGQAGNSIQPKELNIQRGGKEFIDILVPVLSQSDPDRAIMSPEFVGAHKVVGYVRLGLNQDRMNKNLQEMHVIMFFGTSFFILVGVILTLLLTRKMVSPLRNLSQIAHDISEGNLDRQVSITTNDEIADLSRDFNHMMGQLRQYRREANEHQRNLEEKIKERTFELQEVTEKALVMAARAQEANEAKSNFLANMSHELYTPLNAIIGFSEILRDQHSDKEDETQKQYLQDILSSGHHLLSLVQDILDLSKSEAGKMKLESSEIEIESLLKGSLAMVREEAARHGIDLSVEVGDVRAVLTADERKLKQILYNLLSNAIKFTPDHGSISVHATVIERSWLEENVPAPFQDDVMGSLDDHCDSFLHVSVTDTGIGIKPQFLREIFQPFQQEDSSISRRYGGTGLGLSLSKKLLELHKGAIWVESKISQGSTFHVVLPL